MKILILFLLTACSVLAQSTSDLIARADALDDAQRNRESLEVLIQADKASPDNAEILRRMAKQYDQLSLDAKSDTTRRDLGQKSLDYAQRAVKADPKNSNAHLSLAIIYGRIAFDQPPKKKIEMSKLIRDEALTAVKLDPKNGLAWHVLGRWNFEMANFNPFLKGLAQVIYGKFPDASNERAAECFAKAIAVGPPSVVNHVEYGRALAALGKKNEARKQLELGLSLPSKAKDDEETKQRARQALKDL